MPDARVNQNVVKILQEWLISPHDTKKMKSVLNSKRRISFNIFLLMSLRGMIGGIFIVSENWLKSDIFL